MNTPQTRFIALSAKKATNTEHTVINGNQSKCRISSVFSNPGWIALVGIRIINYIDHHALSAQI